MCVMILNYLDKKSMYIGLYKTPNKVLSCLRSCLVLVYTRFSVRVEIESRVTGQILLCTGNARKIIRDLTNKEFVSFIVLLFSSCLFRACSI